jgi:serine/threonine protein phosphatase PrpC
MRLNILDSVCEPAAVTNEDHFDHNAQAAWVFDGASGIGPKTIATSPSDPHWLVQTVNAELKKAWHDDMPTHTLLQAAAEATSRLYGEQATQPLPPLTDRPTACLTMARIWDGTLEVLNAGDCWIIRQSGKDVFDFGTKHDDLAKPVRAERKRLKAAGTPQSEMNDLMAPFERAFRQQANQDGGYVIVDTTTRWVDRLHRKIVPIAPGDSILLMTDGFYRLIDVFGRYDAASMISGATSKGLSALHAELREAEAMDEECIAFPRAKTRDDVAAALFTISQ